MSINKLSWLGACLALVACGGAQLNQARVADVQSSVRAAEAIGANDEPKAALHLQLAKDEMAAARRFAADGDEDNAALMLERARADAELFSKLRALLGLDQAAAVNTGAAPTPVEVLEFFHAIGLPLAEVWGMSETTGAGSEPASSCSAAPAVRSDDVRTSSTSPATAASELSPQS